MQKAQVDRPEGGSTRPVDLATTEASGQRIVRQDYDEKRANTEGKEVWCNFKECCVSNARG